ncbi:MAG: tetratricopeptide repeat protein [bacterium]
MHNSIHIRRLLWSFLAGLTIICGFCPVRAVQEEDTYLKAYTYFKQGADFYARNDNQQAIRLLEEALTFYPQLEGARGLLLIALGEEALVLYQDGAYDKALPYLNKLLKLLPDDEEIKKYYQTARNKHPQSTPEINVGDSSEQLKGKYRMDWMGYVGMGNDEMHILDRVTYLENMYAAYTGTMVGTEQIQKELNVLNIERKKLLAQRSEGDRLSRALELYQEERLREAIEIWNEYLEKKQDPYVERYRDEAQAALEGKLNAMLAQAVSLKDQGKWGQAVKFWKQALLLDPYDSSAKLGITAIHAELKKLFNAGVKKYQEQKYSDAVTSWQKVDAYYPGYQDIDVYINQARARLIQSSAEPAKLLVAQYLKNGDDLKKQGRFFDAVKSWQQVFDVDPQNKTAKNNIQTLLSSLEKRAQDSEQGGDAARAEQMRKLIVSIDPSYKKAKKQLTQKVKKSAVNYDSLIAEGENAFKTGNYIQALNVLKGVLKADRTNTKALELAIESALSQGIIYYRSDKLEEAIQQWDYVLAYSPGHAKAGKYRERAELKLQSIKNLIK